MSNGFTAETIVTQIRSRIAEENARRSSRSQAMSEGPAWDTGRCRQRMEEDGTRFAELDLRLDEAARNIGQQPLAPPTLRGRFGALIVQVLRNLLWWYGLPLKEAVAQIGLRNREQAVRHRLLQEDLLGLSQRIELLDQAFNELPRRSGADCQTAIGLLSAQLQAEVNAREVLAAVVNDQGDRIGSARDSLAVHLQANVDALGAAVRSQGDRIEQVNGALSAQVQAEVHAREVLAGVVDGQGNRIEQVNGDLMAQVQGEVHAREALAGVVDGQGNRIEQLNGALSAQVQAEVHAREVLAGVVDINGVLFAQVQGEVHAREALAGVVDGQGNRIEQVNGDLMAQVQAEVHAREILAGVVNGQGNRIEQVNGALSAQVQGEVHAREVLAGVVSGQGNRIEQVNGALSAQVQAEVHAREVLAGVANGQGNRIEQVNGVLSAQVQGEVHAREVLAGVVNGQGNRIEQVNGALSAQAEAEAHAREALNSFVNDQADKLEKVAGGVEPLAALPGRVSNLAVAHDKQRAALLEQEHRIGMFLREVRHQLPEPLSKTQVQQFTEASANAIGVLYAEFEDTFRGPREVIKERQEVYIRPLKEAKVGAKSAPVLDLGCGRGEWLELLAEHQFVARGVDSNPGMIERCRALGMNVTLSEALAYLRGLPDRSIGAVTSFHMVEHMPFEDVVSLLDQALRVLRSGGVLILETPNPQNVLVGSQTFWIDPTHLKPIPSQTLRFFAEARGFCGAEIWNLQQYPDAIRIPEDSSGTATRFNDYFYGPQDYGLIARRP